MGIITKTHTQKFIKLNQLMNITAMYILAVFLAADQVAVTPIVNLQPMIVLSSSTTS